MKKCDLFAVSAHVLHRFRAAMIQTSGNKGADAHQETENADLFDSRIHEVPTK